MCYSILSTFLYSQQTILILAIGWLLTRFGVVIMLAVMPIVSLIGFGVFGLATVLPVLIGFGVLRRAGEFSITKPTRETLVYRGTREEKYQAKNVIVMVLLVYGFQWLLQMNADGTGYLAQRSMACRSDHDARVAAVVFTVAQVVLRSLIWLPLALGLLVVFPTSTGDDRPSVYCGSRIYLCARHS